MKKEKRRKTIKQKQTKRNGKIEKNQEIKNEKKKL